MLTGDVRPAATPRGPEQTHRPAWRTAACLALLGLLAAGLLMARLATLAPLSYPLDDPRLQADGFYAPEASTDGVRFRWSRPSAGFLLPALSARQVYTVQLAVPRPAGAPTPTGITVAANGVRLPVPANGGWVAISLAASSQIGVGNALAITEATADDSFYPGAGDHRLLLIAARRVTLAPAPGPGGLPWPAPLPGAIALLAPALSYALITRRSRRAAGVAAMVATLAVGTLAWLSSPDLLPSILGAGGAILALAALGAWLWARGDAWAAWLMPPTTQAPIALPLPDSSPESTQQPSPQGGEGRVRGQSRLTETGTPGDLPPSPYPLPPGARIRRLLWKLIEGAALTAGLGGLAIVATWPLATRLGDAVPGWPGDNFAFLYKIWWVKTALTSGANLFADPHVFYPFGFNFGRGEPTLPNTVPGALLALVWGDAAGYNLVLLAGFVLSGLGTYLLARAVGAPRAAALLAGVIFMLAPYRLAQAAGHLQIAATQWIPFTLYFAERALQGKRGAALLSGLCYGLTALTAWYYALIGGLLLVGYVFLRLIEQYRARDAAQPALAGHAAARAVLGFAVVAGIVMLPGTLALLGAAREAPLTYSAKAADENSASLADYLIPNELQPLWGAPAMRAHAGQNIIEDALYLGLPALLLAGLAFWPHGLWITDRGLRRSGNRNSAIRNPQSTIRGAWIWGLLALLCLVLSLGLTLRVLPGVPVTVGGTAVPLPGQWLYAWLPGFNSIRAYARFGGAVLLAVTVLAALGATRLLAWPRLAGRRVAATAALLGLVLLDFWSAPNAWGLTSVTPDAVAAWLAAQPAGGAVIRLPLATAVAGPPLYAGTAYGHPLAYGYETFEPPGFAAARPTLARFPDPAAFALLRAWQVRYVVVAASSYGADWPATRAYFASLPDWTPVYAAAQPVTYQAPFWVGDARPDLLPAFAPDELVVYSLK